MRKMLITLALVAAPVLAAAQQPATPAQTPAAAHDSTKAKSHRAVAHKKPTRTTRDTTKAKAATPAPQDSSKKPN
jgi:hypothetical protein